MPFDPIPPSAGDHQHDLGELIPPQPDEEYFERVAARQVLEAEERQLGEELETRKRMVSFGVPVKDVEAIAIEALDASEAMKHIVRFEGLEEYILILSGPAGCGKTTAAANWLVRPAGKLTAAKFGLKLRKPTFVTAARLFRTSRYDTDAMAILEKASKLVIDDIGTEYSDQKGFVTSFVDGLINERYANLLPTVITTNLRVETFTERYGERVARRVRTVGTFVSIATAPYSGRPTGGQDGERT
jgi:DNA replication protein DnaC